MSKDTITAYIDNYATQSPDKVFLIDALSDSTVSHAKLKSDILALGGLLQQHGITADDKVGFLLDNSYATALLFLGVMYHGLTIVPINVVSGDNQVDFVLGHADCKLVFASSEYNNKFQAILDKHDITLLTCDGIDNLTQACASAKPCASSLYPPATDTPALLIYTSGTTGQPKGVLLSHKNVIAGGQNTAISHQITPEDVALCVLPLYHINGEIVTIMGPLVSHSAVVMLGKFSVTKFWQTLESYRCSWFSVVPTIISYLLNTDVDVKTLDLSAIRFGRSASAALPPEIHRKFEDKFGIHIIETMGLSETAAQILSNPLDNRKIGSAGIAFGNQVEIIDSDENFLSANMEGELVIKGDNVLSSYYKNPTATANTFTKDGWLLTGDLGIKDEDGFFFITGRKKELIIKGGENIAPREIDDVLYKHDCVLEACAFALPDDNYGEVVAVCVLPKEGQTIKEIELKHFCQQSLGDFKTPSKVIFASEPLPKGPSGKILRLQIAKQYA